MAKQALAPVTFDRLCYRIDGEPVYLYSGEFHYFRVPRKDWRRRMRLFKEAGGNCLATYCPWLIHEPEESRFVFEGGHGALEMEAFFDTAAAEGLYVVARPGPYQYSELKYDGLPGWLCDGFPELHAHNLEGKIFRQSSISYLHPAFLEKVRRWFDQVCPRIARHTTTHGGPVAFVQFDNELAGIHTWFGSLDYNAQTMGFGDPKGRFPRYLEAQYGDVARLNTAYGTAFASFADVRPLAPTATGNPHDVRRLRDYFLFYLGTVAEYAHLLRGLMQERGIDVPFVHNSAGPAMNAWFGPLVKKLGDGFLLGSDHYYSLSQEWAQNNPTPQYATHAFYSLESLRLMGFPPTIFELPGGSLSDWPPVTPTDAKACYLANIALGMKGSNFYILTGGPNVPGTGTTADVYDYGASIGPRNEIRPLYQTQKEVGLFLKRRPWLMEAEREYDFRIALDYELPLADQYWRARGDFAVSAPDVWTFVHRGLLSTSFCAGLSPAFVDLERDDWIADTATPLVVPSSAAMARAKQERVVRFLQNGGRVVALPVIPTYDSRLEPCSVLADYLGSPRVTRNAAQFSRVTIAGVVNVYSNGDVFFIDGIPAGGSAVGVDEVSGRTLAAQWRPAGGGEVLFLGLRWSHAKREHEAMLAAVLEGLGMKSVLTCSNPNVWCALRTAGDRSILFLMNLLSAPMEATVMCRPSWQTKRVDAGTHKLGAMSVKVVELRRRASKGRAKSA